MKQDYRDLGLRTYGDRCEICGHSMVEVHHISYQEQQEIEARIRKAVKEKKDITDLLVEAKGLGYLHWDGKQLSKDDRSTNLAVLCSNCHTLVHRMDVGTKLLAALNKRK